jgi:pimeloyl-ACP methyl ester carboxylesterase
MRALLAAALLASASAGAWAGDHLVGIGTRPGVKVGYWWMERPDASATLVLLPGGAGGIGLKGGVPTSTNFLVRSRDRFAAAGFDVAIVGRPSDRKDLDLAFRASAPHIEDLRRVVERVRAVGGKPVWLVGTSRGTVSAAAAAIALGRSIDGVVLTSSITDPFEPQAVQKLALDRIAVPVLVVHHKLDECPATPPAGADEIVAALVHAPVKKLLLVEGGGPAYGPRCEPMHWHGYRGMEREVVDAIAAFVRDPAAAAAR